LGALLSDVFTGKFWTIISLSIVYCLGHLTLALNDTRPGLAIGLGMIAMGAGGIKPCVSAHVGDQFSRLNRHLLERVFSWFYFAINLGAFASTLLTPFLLSHVGPAWAFGVPGFLMLLATWVFWLGRHRFAHIPPGGRKFLRETFNRESMRIVLRLSLLYAFIAVFWSLYDQGGSAWVLQAEQMNRVFLGVNWESAQVQAINPILILTFIPLFSYVVYPLLSRFFTPTPLRKIGMGLFLMVPTFLISAWIETLISRGQTPGIQWQFLAYILLTASEVMVSITALEYSYTQAPNHLKSLVMSLYMLSISLGNLFTAGVNFAIEAPGGHVQLSGTAYYLFFASLMLIALLIYIPASTRFREQSFVQPDTSQMDSAGPGDNS